MPKGVVLAVQSLGPSTHLTGVLSELGVIFWMPSGTLVFVSIWLIGVYPWLKKL